MIEKFVVFDLEFTALVPAHDAHDWGRDVKVACASTMSSDDSIPSVWCERTSTGEIGDYLSSTTLVQFVGYLQTMHMWGYRVVTWGGAATDFRMLCKELPSHSRTILQMCMTHVDVPFAAATHTGMMMGLAAAAKGMGLEDKSNASSLIPALWSSHDRAAVLQHVSTDAFLTAMVVRYVTKHDTLPWITSRGLLRAWMQAQLLDVSTCLQMPLPQVPFAMQDCMNPKILAKWMFTM